MPNPTQITRVPHLLTGLAAQVVGHAAPARIPYGNAAGGMVFVTAKDAGATTITWYVSHTSGGTLYPACDSNGNALTVTIAADKAYEIPGALYGAAEIIPVTNLATATITVALKS